MTDSDSGQTPGARMMLEPDALHEETDELSLDCPQCGSTVSIRRIIEEGHCPSHVDAEAIEVEDEDQDPRGPECTADLSLELVWES